MYHDLKNELEAAVRNLDEGQLDEAETHRRNALKVIHSIDVMLRMRLTIDKACGQCTKWIDSLQLTLKSARHAIEDLEMDIASATALRMQLWRLTNAPALA